MACRILSLLAIAAMGTAELAGDAEFDKITQFLSALDAEVEEDSHRKLYSMDYGDDGCAADQDAVVNAAYGSAGITSCAVAAAGGYCAAYLCPTCAGAGICDTSCGFGGCPSAPTPAPTMVYYVSASISMTGITCDDYGEDEETAVKAGVASIMEGVEVADIGDTTCAGLRRRRALLSAGVSISFTITIRAASESAAAATAASHSSSLATAASSGALASAIVANAVSGSVFETATITVTGVSVALDTPAPTAAPVDDAADDTTTVVVASGAGAVKPVLTALALAAAWALV